jgi:hypothetical protein
MKISLENENDVKCVNWLAIADQIGAHAKEQISKVMLRAADELKELAPGEARKFVVEIGTIEISREIDAPMSHLSIVGEKNG